MSVTWPIFLVLITAGILCQVLTRKVLSKFHLLHCVIQNSADVIRAWLLCFVFNWGWRLHSSAPCRSTRPSHYFWWEWHVTWQMTQSDVIQEAANHSSVFNLEANGMQLRKDQINKSRKRELRLDRFIVRNTLSRATGISIFLVDSKTLH